MQFAMTTLSDKGTF